MSIADSTRRNYRSATQYYYNFCNQHKLVTFPPTEHTLILFATHIASFSSHSNVKLHLAAIKHTSIIDGQNVPFRDYERLYLLLRGIKRAQGRIHSVPKRLPITPILLRTIHHALFNSSRLYEDKVMLWAAIITAFFGFLRVSEYTSLRKTSFDPNCTLLYEDVQIQNNSACLNIKASKTDPFRQGVAVRLAANHTILCPVSALRLYLSLHPTKSGPLFTFQDKKYLSRADLNNTLRDTTNWEANISSHSLRIGAASTADAADAAALSQIPYTELGKMD